MDIGYEVPCAQVLQQCPSYPLSQPVWHQMPVSCSKDSLNPVSHLVLKRRDTVLAKVKDSISFESFMDLRNARLSNSIELFRADILEKAVEKSSRVLHDEVIHKAVAQEKTQHKSAKKLHFSQLSLQHQH